MKNKTFRFYHDAGHGWLAVKRKHLIELGILSEITSYSYQRGDTVYLEEDMDMDTFYRAYKEKFSVDPSRRDIYHGHERGSPIRSYECFDSSFHAYAAVYP
jgi:hypothetical protein